MTYNNDKKILNSNPPIKSPQFGGNRIGYYFDDLSIIQKCVNFEVIKSLLVNMIHVHWDGYINMIQFTYWVETENGYYLVKGGQHGGCNGSYKDIVFDKTEYITNVEVGVDGSAISSLNFTTYNSLTKEINKYLIQGRYSCTAVYQLDLDNKDKSFLCFFGSNSSTLPVYSIGIYTRKPIIEQEINNNSSCLSAFLNFPLISSLKKKNEKKKIQEKKASDVQYLLEDNDNEKVDKLEAFVEVPVNKI